MHLSRLKIHNFRCLEEFEIELQPGLNVILGRNNTGKTAILDAIRVSLGRAACRNDPLFVREEDYYRKTDGGRASNIAIEVEFSDLDKNQRSGFFEIADLDLEDLSKSKAYIRTEVQWPLGNRKPSMPSRSGGPVHPEETQVPQELLSKLPVTYLQALRNAEAALAPGYKSKIASLLSEIATRSAEDPKDRVQQIVKQANDSLIGLEFVGNAIKAIQDIAKEVAGTDYESMRVAPAPAEFDRILQSMRMFMDRDGLEALGSNGLGYNNLLYISVVLAHVTAEPESDVPILLVEEPEAHLHPQLTELLGKCLANTRNAQVIVTTHSPTLAASVKPSQIHVLHRGEESAIEAASVCTLGLDVAEERSLQRMMDVTRSALYFSKGMILVEGISEALLLPEFAYSLEVDLAEQHISVLPISGVAFGVFNKLFQNDGLGIPVAVITDSDPKVLRGSDGWAGHELQRDDAGKLIPCARALIAEEELGGCPSVSVFRSLVTLEYDLAIASNENADRMAEVWTSLFKSGNPETFNAELLKSAGDDLEQRALVVWRGICRASPSVGKADFAHELSEYMASKRIANEPHGITTPEYIKNALSYVAEAVASKKDDHAAQ